MANAMPQAIGAQGRFPDRQVISLSGDGGFAMMMGDFLTLVQYGLPVKVVVYDNGSLGMVKLEQNVAGLKDFGTELKNPDFAKVAEAMEVETPCYCWSGVSRSTLFTRWFKSFLMKVVTGPSESILGTA